LNPPRPLNRPMGPISYGVAARCSRLGLAVALAFVVFRALPNLTYPMGNDQATYGLIGGALLHGQKLYRDAWDMKPPGIFWIYAVMVKLFGTVRSEEHTSELQSRPHLVCRLLLEH